MKRRALMLVVALLGVPALLLSGDSVRADRTANLLELATGFSAKEGCSCAFVVGQTDAHCQDFAQPPGVSFTLDITIDRDAQTVTSGLGDLSRTARFVAGVGCTLDPLP
jgi:hypothetical protein